MLRGLRRRAEDEGPDLLQRGGDRDRGPLLRLDPEQAPSHLDSPDGDRRSRPSLGGGATGVPLPGGTAEILHFQTGLPT